MINEIITQAPTELTYVSGRKYLTSNDTITRKDALIHILTDPLTLSTSLCASQAIYCTFCVSVAPCATFLKSTSSDLTVLDLTNFRSMNDDDFDELFSGSSHIQAFSHDDVNTK